MIKPGECVSDLDLAGLINHIRLANRETEWIEFKLNDDEPADIGEYVSALSNSAALVGQRHAYIVWGISNITHEVIGTSVRLGSKKIGNEELENWLSHQLSPRVNFTIVDGELGGNPVSLIEIPAATHTPVRFRDHEYVRVGSYKKKLRDHPKRNASSGGFSIAGIGRLTERRRTFAVTTSSRCLTTRRISNYSRSHCRTTAPRSSPT
jgi:hypothetical protein